MKPVLLDWGDGTSVIVHVNEVDLRPVGSTHFQTYARYGDQPDPREKHTWRPAKFSFDKLPNTEHRTVLDYVLKFAAPFICRTWSHFEIAWAAGHVSQNLFLATRGPTEEVVVELVAAELSQ